MTLGKVMEGVFAIHKPTGISSAQVLRDCQKQFNPSALFEPWVTLERKKVERESHNQRRRRKQKNIQVKIGHGGTLDPLATGVLIAGIGKGTKVLGDFLNCTKTYETIVLFGASTDTQDRTGKILKRAPYAHITKEMVEEALNQFRGKIMQLPPLYSALKMDGKPLYEYAREGKPIPRNIEKRPVEVTELDLIEFYESGSHDYRMPTEEAGTAEKAVAEALWEAERKQEGGTGEKRKLDDVQDGQVTDRPVSKVKISEESEPEMSGALDSTKSDIPATTTEDGGPPAVKLRMTVTSGFYVRSLCHDLGQAVGSQANMAELIRSRQGQFELGKNVLEYSDLAKGEHVWAPQVERMLDEWSLQYRPFTGSAAEQQVQGEKSESKKQPISQVEDVVVDTQTEQRIKSETATEAEQTESKAELPKDDGTETAKA